MRLKPRLRGRFAPGDRLCGRRGSVHLRGRLAKSLPEAISIAERQAAVRYLVGLLKGAPVAAQRREGMITEAFLRTHDKWGKYLTGLTAPRFWSMFSRIEADFEEYERQRHERPAGSGRAGRGVPLPRLFSSGW